MNADIVPLNNPAPQVFQVPYWDIENLWPKCSPMLQKAIDKQDYWTLEGVKQILLSTPSQTLQNQMQLWYCPNKYAGVTQIQINGSGVRYCVLFLCGGEDLDVIKDSLLTVGPWAKKHFGCTKFRIVGREGWLKVLPNFVKKETIMEGEI